MLFNKGEGVLIERKWQRLCLIQRYNEEHSFFNFFNYRKFIMLIESFMII